MLRLMLRLRLRLSVSVWRRRSDGRRSGSNHMVSITPVTSRGGFGDHETRGHEAVPRILCEVLARAVLWPPIERNAMMRRYFDDDPDPDRVLRDGESVCCPIQLM